MLKRQPELARYNDQDKGIASIIKRLLCASTSGSYDFDSHFCFVHTEMKAIRNVQGRHEISACAGEVYSIVSGLARNPITFTSKSRSVFWWMNCLCG